MLEVIDVADVSTTTWPWSSVSCDRLPHRHPHYRTKDQFNWPHSVRSSRPEPQDTTLEVDHRRAVVPWSFYVVWLISHIREEVHSCQRYLFSICQNLDNFPRGENPASTAGKKVVWNKARRKCTSTYSNTLSLDYGTTLVWKPGKT